MCGHYLPLLHLQIAFHMKTGANLSCDCGFDYIYVTISSKY